MCYNYLACPVFVVTLIKTFNYVLFSKMSHFFFDHFFIHSSKSVIDSISSWPFFVSLYSTRGGTSANVCLSRIPSETSSDSLADSVLLLIPFRDSLNCLCLTGFVVQQSGKRISSVALFVMRSRMVAVSFNSFNAS